MTYRCTAARWTPHGLLPPLKKNEAHALHPDARPSQPTTDAEGNYVVGPCPVCKQRTVWRRVS